MAAVTSESAVAMPRERPGAGIDALDLAVDDGDAAGAEAQAEVARRRMTEVSRIMTC